MLYQLSYWPLRGEIENLTPTKLLGFAMRCVFLATRTKLTELETIRIVTAILFSGVIAFFTVIALKRNNRTNILLLGSHTILPTFFVIIP